MNRFDIVESYYLYFSLTHEGQWSKKYARLSKLLGYFKPGLLLSPDNCSEETKEGLRILLERGR